MSDLERLVHEALDRALANGYGDFLRSPAKDVAEDLVDHECTLEGKDLRNVAVHVAEWQKEH